MAQQDLPVSSHNQSEPFETTHNDNDYYLNKREDDKSDIFFLVSVVSPLLFCCFAIFLCALNSIWKTRKKLEALNKSGRTDPPEYTEFTIDLTTKVDSCVELSSAAISSKEESVLL